MMKNKCSCLKTNVQLHLSDQWQYMWDVCCDWQTNVHATEDYYYAMFNNDPPRVQFRKPMFSHPNQSKRLSVAASQLCVWCCIECHSWTLAVELYATFILCHLLQICNVRNYCYSCQSCISLITVAFAITTITIVSAI